METFAVYFNDQEHGPQHILALLKSQVPARWVFVANPPRMSRHLGRWLSQPAKKKWRMRWSEEALHAVVAQLQAQGDPYEIRWVNQITPKWERALRSEFDTLRIIDVRRTPDRWEVPVGAAAFGTLVTLAAE